jgi:hypothetical protein
MYIAVVGEFAIDFVGNQEQVVFCYKLGQLQDFFLRIQVACWVPGLQIKIALVFGVISFSKSAIGGKPNPTSMVEITGTTFTPRRLKARCSWHKTVRE